eukprot:GCRY01003009.1.p1 GENE.GCRY01003009.1~~GCRY01003009.1.p1  ORF type:complete len:336 (+),score=17.61 GCRY01003009.1:70-1077(+)
MMRRWMCFLLTAVMISPILGVSVSKDGSTSILKLNVNELLFSDGTSLTSGREQCVIGSSSCPARNCKAIKDSFPYAPSGLYYIEMLNGTVFRGYCDMVTDGGGWLLLTKFDANSIRMSAYSETDYEAIFASAQWIQGINVETPASPLPVAQFTTLEVTSVNWSQFLVMNHDYELRTRGELPTLSKALDLSYTFTYPGFILQDDAPSEEERYWPLSELKRHEDTSLLHWPTIEDGIGFYPPFTSSVTGRVYSGCNGFEYSDINSHCLGAGRAIFGTAGVFFAPPSNKDLGFSWFPLTQRVSNVDILFSQMSCSTLWGCRASAVPIVGTYWLRPSTA